jgi:twitching motility protein PilT
LIVIGEMRDLEVMKIALTAAETGHLVLATMHTNDAVSTIDRIIDVFPADAKNHVRIQLASTLVGVVSQHLLVRADGSGRIPACEVLINSPTIEKLIEDNKIGAIGKAIEDSAEFYKMQTFNQALFRMIQKHMVEIEEAMSYSPNPNDLKIKLQSEGLLTKHAEIPVDLPPGLRGGGGRAG